MRIYNSRSDRRRLTGFLSHMRLTNDRTQKRLVCLIPIRRTTRKKNRGGAAAMNNKALVVIDIQNDITKHYRDIIDNINSAVEWAEEQRMTVIYIKHNNLSAGTRTFKPDTKGAELAPELKVVSDNIFVKTKANTLTSRDFSEFIQKKGID